MDIELLQAVGQHLYGESWKRALAYDLGISDRQISRYVNEGHPFSGVRKDGQPLAPLMIDLLLAHEKRSTELRSRLTQYISEG